MAQKSVAFFGSGSLGVPCLLEFARRGWVDVVVSQPDRPAGRGRMNTPTPISTVAIENGLSLIRTDDANDPAVREKCAGAKVLVVIAFGQKLSSELLANRSAINLHPSALPKWRGAAPIQRAMLAGEERITACAMQVAQQMDAGDLYCSSEFVVGATETAGDVHDRIALESVAMMVQTVERALAGKLVATAQIHALATRAHKLSKSEACVDLSLSARMVRSRVHALLPWPGCDADVAGVALRLLLVRDVAGASMGQVGEILSDGRVACGEGAIELLQVQPVGGRAMKWADFCRGRSIQPGQFLTSNPRKEHA